MSGKSYTMGEMKTIVEYLVEHKFYSEIRARKMWMDFANSKLTNRTWQSLKETFLKRILPDIHNPYYKLTTEQINSFRSGYDVLDRQTNKLEIHTISDDSNSNDCEKETNQKDNEQPNNGNINEGETKAGENRICSKIPSRSRSSADTVVLDQCYGSAEEIQKDLESNGDQDKDEKPVALSKSLRDCITYSEPLTPMLQEVLDDFASDPDDSDRENQMEIVESVPDNENSEENNMIPGPENEILNSKSVANDIAKNAKGLSAEVVEEVLAQELDGGNKTEIKSPKKTKSSTIATEEVPVIKFNEITTVQIEKRTEKDNTNTDTTGTSRIVIVENSEHLANNDKNTEISVTNDTHTEPITQSGGLNNSNSTVDASLPNNPEALKGGHSVNSADKKNETHENVVKASNNAAKTDNPLKAPRKRSCSLDSVMGIESKKKKLESNMKPSPKKHNKPVTESPVKKDTKYEKFKLKVADEKLKSDKVSNNSVIKKPQVENNSVLHKPSTSRDNDLVDKTLTKIPDEKKDSDSEIKNPCLENVSLFDEQFNKTHYNMSESSDTEQNKKETKVNKEAGTAPNGQSDVVLLNSHTESETEEINSPPKKKNRAGVLSSKSERDKVIANMFGFTSGGVGSKRRRQLSRRSRTISHNNATHTTAVSNSSEWTSEAGSETFVAPPRGRKNRLTRKYLKPKSAKILSLEEEGGLFVMYGKKIYPLIKDGKIVKNYLTYLPESDSEEGESYWKLKYVEEKKKAAELKTLLERAKEKEKEPESRDRASPILQANPLRNSKSSHKAARESSLDNGKELCVPDINNKKDESKVNPPEKIKIKFTKNNEEVHLEGHWPQIHPVLEQVVQIFHKELEPTVSESKTKMIAVPPGHSKEPSSGSSTPIIITPVDPEIHEKVNKIETEIFKEIEERDREEEDKPSGQETNVTKRKAGRPRKSSSTASLSPVKRPRTSSQSDRKESEENTRTSNKRNVTETEDKVADKDDPPKRQTRTLRKVLNESANTYDSKTVQTRQSKPKLDTSKTTSANDDAEVRYMLPRKSKRQTLHSPANKKTNQKPQKSSTKPPKLFASPENFSLNSMESTQGYQDSDVSPMKTELRKKKKLNLSSFVIKTRNSLRRSTRRRSHPYLYCDAYNDSNYSSVSATVKRLGRENSSLNTEAYRSESYQLLMPQANSLFRVLEPIDETNPISSEGDFVRHFESMPKIEKSIQMNNDCNGQLTSDVCSSSNVSLPMSPELSVVENMSISKDMLNSIDDYPTLNEMQSNEVKESKMCSKYMISDVDVSVPLMQQNCGLESCSALITDAHVSNYPNSLVTESLLSKIGTFSINDQVTATDTLDKKLHDLLLESAKKMTRIRTESVQNKESMMEVDISNVEVQKKSKSKKRCSTPRKRKSSQKSVAPKVEPVVEEEHVESYSKSGRKSCPPLLRTYMCEENTMNEELNIANLSIGNAKPKGRKKKNIIKVKIQRPKNKKSQEKLEKRTAQNQSRISVFSDSGINDTESGVFLPIDDSVDLIHNHSETCLQANECVGDSIEFVENSKSVITLGDSMQSGDNVWHSQSEYIEADKTYPDLYCNNAQDVRSIYNKTNTDNIETSSDTVYHSPLSTEVSHNSLITEDLSDDLPQPPVRPTKWYLLSEDDTTHANLLGQGSTALNIGSFGSNLKQLFPIACAVPDLSTISEMSRENEDSRKPMLDLQGLTVDDFNSGSNFDSNS